MQERIKKLRKQQQAKVFAISVIVICSTRSKCSVQSRLAITSKSTSLVRAVFN